MDTDTKVYGGIGIVLVCIALLFAYICYILWFNPNNNPEMVPHKILPKKKKKKLSISHDSKKNSISITGPNNNQKQVVDVKPDDEFVEINFKVNDNKKKAKNYAENVIDRLIADKDFEDRVVYKTVYNTKKRKRADVKMIVKGDENDPKIKEALALLAMDEKVSKVKATPPKKVVEDEEEPLAAIPPQVIDEEEPLAEIPPQVIDEAVSDVKSEKYPSQQEEETEQEEQKEKIEENPFAAPIVEQRNSKLDPDEKVVEVNFRVKDKKKEPAKYADDLIARLYALPDFRIVSNMVVPNPDKPKEANVQMIVKQRGNDENEDAKLKEALEMLASDDKVRKVRATPLMTFRELQKKQANDDEDEQKLDQITEETMETNEDDGKVDEWAPKKDEKENDDFGGAFELPPMDLDENEHFVTNDITRTDSAIMPPHDTVIMLSFTTKCPDSARNVTESLMRKCVRIPNFVPRVWEKKIEYNESETKAHVKFLLHFQGDDIMQCEDVKSCLDMLKSEEKVKGIKVEKYEYLSKSKRNSDNN